jgi:hypothetical protein
MNTNPPPKKKRKVFFWFFLAAQILFLIWIIAGVHSGSHVSASNCNGLDTSTCQAAADTGTAIGAGLVIALWVAFDLIVGITYAIYRLVKSRG